MFQYNYSYNLLLVGSLGACIESAMDAIIVAIVSPLYLKQTLFLDCFSQIEAILALFIGGFQAGDTSL